MGWNHVFGYFGPIKWSCLIIGSHPKRIETCFLVVIDDLKWYLVPIWLFSGKLSHFSIFFRVAAGDSFRSSNPNHQYQQLVYLSLVPRCPEGLKLVRSSCPETSLQHPQKVGRLLNLWNHLFFCWHGFIAVSLFSRAIEGIWTNQATCLEIQIS